MNRIFLLDRSGSMDRFCDDTIGGFNTFVNSQKELGGTMSLVQFDHEYNVSYTDTPIDDVKPLTRETFVPRGSTALLDAIGRVIKDFTDPLPTVIILTDGHENSSKKYTKSHIKDLIDQKTKDGWTFMYLGANQDAFAEADSIGISSNNTFQYDEARTPEVFNTLHATLSSQASVTSPLTR